MAEHHLEVGQRAVHAELTAGVEDVVTVPAGTGRVTLILHPADPVPVWVAVGDEPAAPGAGHCRILFPGWAGELPVAAAGVLTGLVGAGPRPSTAPATVRLISAAACGYSVELP